MLYLKLLSKQRKKYLYLYIIIQQLKRQKEYNEKIIYNTSAYWFQQIEAQCLTQAVIGGSKEILMIFLIKEQAAWLFHLTRYWFPRRRSPVKSRVQ